jgi:hypothetical protein
MAHRSTPALSAPVGARGRDAGRPPRARPRFGDASGVGSATARPRTSASVGKPRGVHRNAPA